MKHGRDRLLSFRTSLCMLAALILLLLSAPAARAESLSGACSREGNDLRWTLDKDGVLTISGQGDMADYPENSTRPWPVASVRSLVVSEGVSSLGDFAFFGCRRLESVSLPNTLRSIGTRAFFFCSRLRSLALPDSVTELGQNPFAHCSSLASVAVGPGNPALAVRDGALFSVADARLVWYPNGSPGTSFAVPEGIRALDDYAFSFCRALRTVELPETLVTVGARAFDGCASLCGLTLPMSLREIGKQAFAGCSGLRALVIPEGVTALGPYTFARCGGLAAVTIPDSVTAISETAFYRCFSLRLTVGKGSAAERFSLENGIPCVLAE